MMSVCHLAENDLKREAIRLGTFVSWPHSSPAHPVLLAKVGFYYSGEEDSVTCYRCKVRKHDWKAEDIPSEVHKDLNADCPIVCGTANDNIPFKVPSDDSLAYALLSWFQSGHSTFDEVTGYQELMATIIRTSTMQRSAMEECVMSGRNVTDATSTVDELDMRTNDEGGELLDITNESLYEEAYRLETFRNWPPGIPVRPPDLAKAGFYYTNVADRVRCAFCNGLLRNWVEGDDPMTEHISHFPTCPFAMGDPTENAPLQNQALSPVDVHSWTTVTIVTEQPRHPEFATSASRISSYTKWPPNKRQQPQELAQAGLYYAGFGDNVKCFFCDGGLRNWEPNDEPWIEHAKWFPRCAYVIQCKGTDFIKSAQQQPSPTWGPKTASTSRTSLRGESSATGGSHHVEPRQVNARLDTPTVQAVLSRGYARDKVKKVIERRLQTTGDDFPNASALMEAMFALEEESQSTTAGTSSTPLSRQSVTEMASTSNPAPGTLLTGSDRNIVKEAQSLMEENRMLREEMTCKICMDRESNVVFLPCGHLVCCTQCAPSMRKCPICRATIRGCVRTYMS